MIKRFISVITVIAVLATMFVFVPSVQAAVSVKPHFTTQPLKSNSAYVTFSDPIKSRDRI